MVEEKQERGASPPGKIGLNPHNVRVNIPKINNYRKSLMTSSVITFEQKRKLLEKVRYYSLCKCPKYNSEVVKRCLNDIFKVKHMNF